ncbi:tyrosine--tRNA ligase [Candidatus Berkelbacteria bacterium]|nr:tyrosine--tRNA ligase [Candidatus Berkelbacteria bacterium]
MAKPHWQLALDSVYPGLETLEQIKQQKKLRVYTGVDLTGPTVHIGHASTLRVLRRFQDEGHQVIFLFGDFTAMVGDPTGRDKQRPVLTQEEIDQNKESYLEQLAKVLDMKTLEVRSNSEWYADPDRAGALIKFLPIARQVTAAQLWERDMFQERQAKGQPVTLSEFIYPVLQAYDSIELDVDLEIGATDQTFNMLAGRDLVKKMTGKDKLVLTTKILRGTDGRKMSKSYNNYIGVTDTADQMFGKLMSVRDELLPEYFALAAGIDPDQPDIKELISNNPRLAKARMAAEVVAFYHGAGQAEAAQRQFDAQFKDGVKPANIPIKRPTSLENQKIVDLIVDLDLASSKSEAARLIVQGGVKVDNLVIEDQFGVVTPVKDMVIQVGKRRFVKIDA